MFQVYEKYGIKFNRINENDLETVRAWRNSDFVRSKMLYQEYISAEMQKKWFLSVNNENNYYFIVQYNNEDVGVANIKDIVNNEGESGFYLVNESYKNTSIAPLFNIVFGYFLFDVLGLVKLRIHVRKDNPEALKFNMFLGYKMIEEKCGDNFYYLELTKADFANNKKINKLLNYISKNYSL